MALDLRELDFLDSSGLRLVVLADRAPATSAGAGSCSCAARRPVQRVFEITRMTERLEFVDAPEHALTLG